MQLPRARNISTSFGKGSGGHPLVETDRVVESLKQNNSIDLPPQERGWDVYSSVAPRVTDLLRETCGFPADLRIADLRHAVVRSLVDVPPSLRELLPAPPSDAPPFRIAPRGLPRRRRPAGRRAVARRHPWPAVMCPRRSPRGRSRMARGRRRRAAPTRWRARAVRPTSAPRPRRCDPDPARPPARTLRRGSAASAGRPRAPRRHAPRRLRRRSPARRALPPRPRGWRTDGGGGPRY